MAGSPVFYGSQALNDGFSYFLLEKPFTVVTTAESLFAIARVPGKKKSGQYTGERTLSLKVKVVGTSRANLEQLLDAMQQALNIPQQPLTIHTDSRYYVADCIGVQTTLVPGQILACEVQIDFLAQCPYAFAAASSTFSTGMTTLTSAGSGTFTFPSTISFAGGGTVYSQPTITLQSGNGVDWTQVTLTNTTDNQVLQLTSGLPINNGDVLTLICDPTVTNGLSVTLNGGSPQAFNGNLSLYQEPTPTVWTITIAGASAPHCNATWTWTPRYLS